MAAAHTGRVNLMVHPVYEVNKKNLRRQKHSSQGILTEGEDSVQLTSYSDNLFLKS